MLVEEWDEHLITSLPIFVSVDRAVQRLLWQGVSGSRAPFPIVVERFSRGAARRGAKAPLKALAWSARLASIFSLTILCASVAAALPPIANFMARSPITEEASNPNKQASP